MQSDGRDKPGGDLREREEQMNCEPLVAGYARELANLHRIVGHDEMKNRRRQTLCLIGALLFGVVWIDSYYWYRSVRLLTDPVAASQHVIKASWRDGRLHLDWYTVLGPSLDFVTTEDDTRVYPGKWVWASTRITIHSRWSVLDDDLQSPLCFVRIPMELRFPYWYSVEGGRYFFVGLKAETTKSYREGHRSVVVPLYMPTIMLVAVPILMIRNRANHTPDGIRQPEDGSSKPSV